MSAPKYRQHFRSDGLPKASFPDQKAALSKTYQLNGSGPRRFRAYQCSFCELWHVGARRGGNTKAGPLSGRKK